MKHIATAIALLFFFAGTASADEMDRYRNYTLQNYRDNLRSDTNKKLAEAYVSDNDLLFADAELMRVCLSENAYTKDAGIKASDVLDWCRSERDNTPDAYYGHVDLDRFIKGFSAWDGSYAPLEELVRTALRHPETYKHEQTTYTINLHPKKGNPSATVRTVFTAEHTTGKPSRGYAVVNVDLKTLDLEYVDEKR